LTSKRFFIKTRPGRSSFVLLGGEEHHHLTRVVRIREGDEVHLFDGDGTAYAARVVGIEKGRTRLFILDKDKRRKPGPPLTLAPALIRSHKMDLVLQKAAELGVDRVLPVITRRTVIRLEGGGEKKLVRWRRIVREAAKQSGNPFLPQVYPPAGLAAFLEEREEEKKLFLSEREGIPLRDILVRGLEEKGGMPSSVVLLVGPEGGWTEEEEKAIMEGNFEAVTLGRTILRSETAAIAAAAMVVHFWKA